MNEPSQPNSPAQAVVAAPVKPGYSTSEFWLTVAVGGAAILNRRFGLHLSPEELLAVAVPVATYALSRMGTKRAAALAAAVAIPIAAPISPPVQTTTK